MVAFIEGPLWYLASTVFVLGVLWRFVEVLRLGRRDDLAPARAGTGALGTLIRRSWPRKEMLKPTTLQFVAGYMFHIGLFVLVVFAEPHVRFVEELTGLSWTPIPHWAFLLAADFAFAGLLLLWLRRLLDPVTRLLSTADDHWASILTFVAMFTGCMALFESFDALRGLHLLSVEILMIYFPFSRLMHAFFFVTSRGYTGATYGRRGLSV